MPAVRISSSPVVKTFTRPEVERVLESFPGVAAAGVFGMPDEVWGHTVAAALVAGRLCPDVCRSRRILRYAFGFV